jgi:uncharacterized spore protein YtfJ
MKDIDHLSRKAIGEIEGTLKTKKIAGESTTVEGNTLIHSICVGLAFSVGAGEGKDPKKGFGKTRSAIGITWP